jgi:hypothetical protein
MRNISEICVLALLIVFGSGPGIAQVQAKANDSNNLVNALTATIPTQARLLIEINSALVHGSISSEQAVNLRQEVEDLGNGEDRYLIAGNPIPLAVIRQETSRLEDIHAKLERYLLSAPIGELKGSAVLQDRVKSEVDSCLAQGKIPANQASELSNKVNSICTEEAWYLSVDTGTIPEKVIEEDVKQLNDLDGQLKSDRIGSRTNTL